VAVDRPQQERQQQDRQQQQGWRGLDRRAIGRGASIYLLIAIPCGLLIALLHGNDPKGHESGLWVVAAVLVLLVAPVIGGAVAAAAAEGTPLTHAAVAVSLPAGIFLIGRILVGLAQGRLTATQVVSFALYLVVFTGLAMVGGWLGFWRKIRAS
jgi:hypothetical protein